VRIPLDRLPSTPTLLRLGMAAFVLTWIFGPYALRAAVPIWLPFLIALGLELNFFFGALRPAPARRSDRGPQDADRERFGYDDEAEELLLVREGGEELWIPYSGETDDELKTMIDEARELPEEDVAAPTAVADPDRERMRLPFRRLLVGLGLIGALALVFWFVESRTG
jgi:hypothetical protein